VLFNRVWFVKNLTSKGRSFPGSRNEPGRGAGNQQLLIGPDDADGHPAVFCRNDRGVGGVAAFVQSDAEELQAVGDAAVGLGRVLADPSGEDERIKAAECRRQRPEPRLCSVAESTALSSCSRLASATKSLLPGIPIRSMRPERSRSSPSVSANSANLRLDEPTLIVRMRGRSARSDSA
jgi:hypothetical protein